MGKSGSSKFSLFSIVEALWLCMIFYCMFKFVDILDGGDPRDAVVACIAGVWLVFLFPVREDKP